MMETDELQTEKMGSKSKQEQYQEKLNLVEFKFAQAFEKSTREPRSSAYKKGVMAALRYRYAGIPIQQSTPKFEVGSASRDAFLYGVEEGHRIWRDEPDVNHQNHQKLQK